jgi:DNA polymerase III subunit epsilon
VHAGARLVLAPHPAAPERVDAFWIVGGRIADWGPLPADPAEVVARTASALEAAPGAGGWLPADELDEARIVGLWLAGHEATPVLELPADQAALAGFTSRTADARPTRAPTAARAARARAPAPGW